MPSPSRRSPWHRFLRTLFPWQARPVHQPRRSAARVRVELLEDRAQPSTLTLLGQQFTGGSGNEVGTGIAVAPAGTGYAVYLSGRSDANDGDGLLARFNTPANLSAATLAFSQSWPGAAGYDSFGGVAATSTAVYAFGAGYSHTTDGVGDKESKAITVAFPAAGGAPTWERQTPGAPGVFPYGGIEDGYAVTSAVEGGQTYLYATGYAQQNGANGGRIYLSKVDTAGNVLWTRVDPLPAGQFTSNSIGEAVTAAGGKVYVAGWNFDTGAVRATLRAYDSAGTLLWAKTTDPGLFLGVTADPATGAVYAVGGTDSPSGDFLATKFDAAGNVVWSRTFDRAGGADRLTGVTLLNDRLYAVGSTTGAGTAGGSDGVVLEIDPANGATAGTTLWGGTGDDSFAGIAATPTGLHLSGTTASFGSGGTDMAYVVYGVATDPPATAFDPYALLALDPQSTLVLGLGVADFTGDGKADVVVGYSNNTYPYNPAQFAVFAGNGDGTFGPPQTFAAGTTTYGGYLDVGDFNRDGKPDVVVTGGGSNALGFGNQVAVRLGDGAGGFGPAQVFTTGGSDSRVVAGDFNEDGAPDLAVYTSDESEVAVHLNDGAGHFTAPTYYVLDSARDHYAGQHLAADLNGDGHLDLAVPLVGGSNRVHVLFGDGHGTFTPGPVLPVPGGVVTPTYGLVAADLDEDGTADLAIAAGTEVYVYRGTGGGAFAAPVGYAALPAGRYGSVSDVADFNGDGHRDVVVSTFNGDGTQELAILQGDGRGGFAAPLWFDAKAGSGYGTTRAADLNGDGKPDVVATSMNNAQPGVSVLLNRTAFPIPPNAAPTANPGGPYATTYGNGLTLSAAGSSDPDGDALTYSWTVNGHAAAATGVNPTLSWADLKALGVDHAGSYTVTVTADDGHGHAVTSASANLTVNKAALTATVDADPATVVADPFTKIYGQANPSFGVRYAGFVNGDTAANLVGSLSFATTATQSSVVGSYTVTASGVTSGNYDITFVDGTLSIGKAPSSVAVTGGTFTYDGTTHAGGSAVVSGAGAIDSSAAVLSYTGDRVNPGTYTVIGTFAGDANHYGSSGSATITIAVPSTPGASLLPGGRLLIIGTSGDDDIKVNPGGGAPEIKVKINGNQQTFLGVTNIVAYANGGNDDVQIVGGIRLPVTVFGGAGNDTLRAGGGDSVLVGGDGNDTLLGGAGRDILIGGNGADLIGGSAADDILIAGSTAFDNSLAALDAIRAEWTSARTFADRVANLSGTAPAGSANANGAVLLTATGAGRTVFDDTAVDTLAGDGGTDWFMFNSVGGQYVDRVSDMTVFEGLFATDL